jgi:hypothetical protein
MNIKRLLLLFSTAFIMACPQQDPLFYKISREVKPLEPRIKGVPTKMVVFQYDGVNYGMYVASSSLHRYAGAAWDEPGKPDGRIFDLAATEHYLYAMVNDDSWLSPDDMELWRLGNSPGAVWERVYLSGHEGYSRLQAIYGETNGDGTPITGGYLYVGTSNSSPTSGGGNYAVFYLDDSVSTNSLVKAATGIHLLTGAASDGGTNHYFSTKGGNGIYRYDGTVVPPATSSVVGMIKVGAKIVAICANGNLFEVTPGSPGSTSRLNSNSNRDLRGPAAVWKNNAGVDVLLLVALNDTPTHGYREILLNASGTLDAGTIDLRHPGNAPTTEPDSNRYDETINPKPLVSIFQAPASIDSARTLFASVQGTGTTTNGTDGGLWSYRGNRDGGWQWNAEE